MTSYKTICDHLFKLTCNLQLWKEIKYLVTLFCEAYIGYWYLRKWLMFFVIFMKEPLFVLNMIYKGFTNVCSFLKLTTLFPNNHVAIRTGWTFIYVNWIPFKLCTCDILKKHCYGNHKILSLSVLLLIIFLII